MLQGSSTVNALTCSTLCLVCLSRRSSVNRMVSVGVSLVVPSMTVIASFRTRSSFPRFVCDIVSTRSAPHFDTVGRGAWCCSVPFAAIFRTDREALRAPQCCCFLMLSVGQHYVEVDPELFQMVCSFPALGDGWRRFACCSSGSI